MTCVEKCGVKLKMRQVLRRAMVELATASRVAREKKEEPAKSEAKAASPKGREEVGDWFTKRKGKGEEWRGRGEEEEIGAALGMGLIDTNPMLTTTFLLENVYNFNSSLGGKAPDMEVLTCGPALDRAITILDRTPPLMTHKIAVLFAGSGNGVRGGLGGAETDVSREQEMISARFGSPQYVRERTSPTERAAANPPETSSV